MRKPLWHQDAENAEAGSKALADLLEKARRRVEAMSEDELQAMLQAQRESFARGMSTPCEHGYLDFEQCSACRDERPRTMEDIHKKQSKVNVLRPARKRENPGQ